MADIETLRRHEQSLRGLLRSQPNHTRDPFVEALQWSLARVREALAQAEQCGECFGDGFSIAETDHGNVRVDCEACKGTGKR